MTQLAFDFVEEFDRGNQDESVLLRLSKEQTNQLRECFCILNDALTIAETIEQSCVGILSAMTKPEGRKHEQFIYNFLLGLGKLKRTSHQED